MAVKNRRWGKLFNRLIIGVVFLLVTYTYVRYGRNSGGSGPAEDVSFEVGNGYEALQKVRFLKDRSYDGDSFWIWHAKGQANIRLYFVDTPETTDRFSKRVKYQADYFGISERDATSVGKAAKRYVGQLLGRESFAVLTRWESVKGSDRKFGMIRFDQAPHYLCERLVEKGFARIYTKPEDLPDGTSKWEFRNHLYAVEDRAAGERVGAWKKSNGRGDGLKR